VSRGGRLALVLHAHLPFIRHPEHPRHLEEHWLFEAIGDCYLPLIAVLRSAARRGSRFRLTLSLSPTLLAMLADPLLRLRYRDYLDRLIRLCEREIDRHGADSGLAPLTRYHHARALGLRALYEDDLGGDLIRAWVDLRDAGLVELIATTATHGYLPLLRSRPESVRAQLGVGSDAFAALTGRAAEGLWLPECGYYPGLEGEMAAAGFRYTVLETHGIEQGRPSPPWGVYAPVEAGGVAMFGRDPDSAREIWDRRTGYPGQPCYREYHRDLGFEAGADVLGDFLPPAVERAPTGIKYHRVTGGEGPKALYDPRAGLRQADDDAGRFIANRCRRLAPLMGGPRPPVAVAPYDAELFGHWWHEGPAFLDALIRRLDGQGALEPVTLGGYLAQHGSAGECRPAASSWGEQGYNAAWLRPGTGYVHLHLHQAAGELAELIRTHAGGPGDSSAARLLRQAARTLLLAQGSDWTFHLGRGGGSDYAQARLRALLARFAFLTAAVPEGREPGVGLAALERMDSLFPRLDLRHFS
jgi:1,4-alpha-glucan branching enzyme